MQFERFIMGPVARHTRASQYSGHDGHGHRHPTVKGIMGMMSDVFRLLQMVFRPVCHNALTSLRPRPV